jgi:hypothetical protein
VLHDLVLGVERSTTNNVGGVTRTRLLNGERILANIFPPDVADGACALAVDTFSLILADDDVLDGAAGLNDKDSVILAGLGLPLAFATWSSIQREYQINIG